MQLKAPISLFNSARAAGLASLCFSILAGCSQGDAGGPPPEMAVQVVIEQPEVTTVEDTVVAVGTIEANERVELKPEAAGVIESILFTEGRQVRQGEKLFGLASRKEAARVAQAAAEEKLAEANVARARTLIGTRAISQQEVDQLESQVAVKAATRQLEEELLLERSIVAPFDGTLGPRLVSPGQYVNAGTLLATIVDDSKVKVTFRIPERQLALVRQGQQGRLRLGAYNDKSFFGQVDLINPEVDQATRTVEVRLVAPNAEHLLKPGMFARVELVVGSRAKALVIPEGALVPSLENFSVYAVEDGVAKLTPVQLGVRLPGKVEIRDGLSASQPIVVSGTQKLVDGMKVIAAKPSVAHTASFAH
jgi:membrane fusion protein, multidrug efflux system